MEQWVWLLWEGIQKVSLGQWVLLLSILLNIAAAWYAYRSSRSGERSVLIGQKSAETSEKSLAVSEEQLKIARDQAARRPKLEVVNIALLPTENVEAIREKIRVVEEEREAKEREAKGEDPEYCPERLVESRSGVRPDDYEGRLPNAVVDVMLVNRGGATANSITGWLYFEIDRLRPIPYFSDLGPGTMFVPGRLYRVTVGGDQDSPLFPSPSVGADIYRDKLDFLISVLVTSENLPATTNIGYEFVTPSGDSVRGDYSLELPNWLERYQQEE